MDSSGAWLYLRRQAGEALSEDSQPHHVASINDNIFHRELLPPERELAKQLGVSRASLREALLYGDPGWIVIQSGNGVIVSDKNTLPATIHRSQPLPRAGR